MGLFDLFKSKQKDLGQPPAAPADKNVARLGRVAADRHAQNYDRMEAIESLTRVQTADAAAALLKRFTFYIDPSITDQEEKELAFEGIVATGEAAIDPILDFSERAENLSWPLKTLKAIESPEDFITDVIELLEGHDTDYARNVDPKLQLLASLDGEHSEKCIAEVSRFLEDVSEPVRFQAVLTLLSSELPAVAEKLVALAPSEESVRIRNKIAEGMAARTWKVGEADRDKFAQAVSVGGFWVEPDGTVRSR